MKSTRKAYGEAITKLGEIYPDVVVLDAETKNSTFVELFKVKFPKRYFDCFIAEQNMVGLAVGMAKIGKIPFVSTFAAFLTRAYDQIRMAGLGEANVKLVGSHCGVSIGEDGYSQMGLEDIAMMRTVFNSVVLYPSDDVSTAKLVEEIVKRKGLCYLRTTRADTETIYSSDEEFKVGGFKIHHLKSQNSKVKSTTQNLKRNEVKSVTIITAGITLHEALKAQKELEGKVDVTVIDLYSVKPINEEELRKAVVSDHIITVEDHWYDGGLGDAVLNVFAKDPKKRITKLAVTSLPHSGTPFENLSKAGIDCEKISRNILDLIT